MLNEILLYIQVQIDIDLTQTNKMSKMVLLKNTVIIPSTELISFLIDISRVVDFQTYNKINSIADRLVKDDYTFYRHKVTQTKV